ncbi:MAG: hypothetical protein CVU14_00840 [Bacteroidetes bacterium HGW-Bacteroidetes-9]|nr:MAG: hypothetical protein CVU14_00840 [Bacteroidetes bacterium HGW-Bacteroidetes-9]
MRQSTADARVEGKADRNPALMYRADFSADSGRSNNWKLSPLNMLYFTQFPFFSSQRFNSVKIFLSTSGSLTRSAAGSLVDFLMSPVITA